MARIYFLQGADLTRFYFVGGADLARFYFLDGADLARFYFSDGADLARIFFRLGRNNPALETPSKISYPLSYSNMAENIINDDIYVDFKATYDTVANSFGRLCTRTDSAD